MQLSVKRGDTIINELRFSRGPIYIGRQIGSQIFLPDRAVSRQHTVIYTTTEGKWVVEDLDSANKTYLNDKAIHKSELNEGDVIRIADFTIDVRFGDSRTGVAGAAVSLDDTLHATLHEPEVVHRRLGAEDAPLIRMASRRSRDFASAITHITKCRDLDDLLTVLIDISFRQFSAANIWVGFRSETHGPMSLCKGKSLAGRLMQFDELPLRNHISEAVEHRQYTLIPRLPLKSEQYNIRSALAAPLIFDGDCYGVLYFDNSLNHEHYGLSDLDYLMIVSIHAAAMLWKLIHGNK